MIEPLVPLNSWLDKLGKGFGSPMGTSSYYRYPVVPLLYTDGIKDMCTSLNCFWLIDLIASYQIAEPCINKIRQYWQLKAYNNEATAFCQGDNNHIIVMQNIPYADLPNGQIFMKVEWNEYEQGKIAILALPVEG